MNGICQFQFCCLRYCHQSCFSFSLKLAWVKHRQNICTPVGSRPTPVSFRGITIELKLPNTKKLLFTLNSARIFFRKQFKKSILTLGATSIIFVEGHFDTSAIPQTHRGEVERTTLSESGTQNFKFVLFVANFRKTDAANP